MALPENKGLNPFEQNAQTLEATLINGFFRLLFYTGRVDSMETFNLKVAPLLEQIAKGTYNMDDATSPAPAGGVLDEEMSITSSKVAKSLLRNPQHD
jgi:hypothetical protein